MGEHTNTDWPVVGQPASTVSAHSDNLKNDIQKLLAFCEGSGAEGTTNQMIPQHLFKSFSDSVLVFLHKIHDQPSLKEIAESIERVNQTTKTIMMDVHALKTVQRDPVAVITTTPAPPAVQPATTAVVAQGQLEDLQGISPQMAAAIKKMSPEMAEKFMSARRKSQATLQARGSLAESWGISDDAALNVGTRPVGLKTTRSTAGDSSKLVLQSQKTEQGKCSYIVLFPGRPFTFGIQIVKTSLRDF
jgi:hypothetical protein